MPSSVNFRLYIRELKLIFPFFEVQDEPIEAQVDVQDEPIEAQVDAQDEPMEEVILDQYIPVVPVAQLTPLAPATPVASTSVASTSVASSPPKLSKAFNDYSPRQQFNLAKNIKDYFVRSRPCQ